MFFKDTQKLMSFCLQRSLNVILVRCVSLRFNFNFNFPQVFICLYSNNLFFYIYTSGCHNEEYNSDTGYIATFLRISKDVRNFVAERLDEM